MAKYNNIQIGGSVETLIIVTKHRGQDKIYVQLTDRTHVGFGGKLDDEITLPIEIRCVDADEVIPTIKEFMNGSFENSGIAEDIKNVFKD